MTPQDPRRGEDEIDDEARGTAPRFVPSEAWIDRFTEQCTDELRLRAKRFALRRLHGLARAGAHVDEFAARELVQDILGDTLMGVRNWDPEAKTLQQHLEDVICSRVKHQRDRAKRFRHHRVDLFAADHDRQGTRSEIEASLQMDGEQASLPEAVAARETIDRIRAIAADDKAVMRVLDAIEAGADSRADIVHATGLSEKAFRNARGRLQRIADRLDSTVSPLQHA